MATQGMKNWEAQARTNSILAGSLKALEERLDELDGFVDWRMDVDNKVEEIFDTLEELESKLKDVQEAVKKKNGSMFGGKGQREETPEEPSTSLTTVDELKVTDPLKSVTEEPLKPEDPDEAILNEIPFDDPFFTRWKVRLVKFWKKITLEENTVKTLPYQFLCLFVFGAVFVFFFIDITDPSSKLLPLLLALSCFAGAGFGHRGVKSQRRGLLALHAHMQTVIAALGAVFLHSALADYVKTIQFCDLLPQPVSDCSSRELMSSIRVLAGLLILLTSIEGAVVGSMLREKLHRDEILEAAKKLVKKGDKRSERGSARTPYGNQSWDMQNKKSSSVSRVLASQQNQLNLVA
jgi:hypothetical protein